LRIKARKMQGKRSLNSVNTPTVRSWEVYLFNFATALYIKKEDNFKWKRVQLKKKVSCHAI
jgi:hypothetical protein